MKECSPTIAVYIARKCAILIILSQLGCGDGISGTPFGYNLTQKTIVSQPKVEEKDEEKGELYVALSTERPCPSNSAPSFKFSNQLSLSNFYGVDGVFVTIKEGNFLYSIDLKKFFSTIDRKPVDASLIQDFDFHKARTFRLNVSCEGSKKTPAKLAISAYRKREDGSKKSVGVTKLREKPSTKEMSDYLPKRVEYEMQLATPAKDSYRYELIFPMQVPSP